MSLTSVPEKLVEQIIKNKVVELLLEDLLKERVSIISAKINAVSLTFYSSLRT